MRSSPILSSRRRAYRLIGSLFTLLILFVTGYSVWGRVKLEQTSEALQTQNLRFDAALNNMSHGLCMFDATGPPGGVQRALPGDSTASRPRS